MIYKFIALLSCVFTALTVFGSHHNQRHGNEPQFCLRDLTSVSHGGGFQKIGLCASPKQWEPSPEQNSLYVLGYWIAHSKNTFPYPDGVQVEPANSSWHFRNTWRLQSGFIRMTSPPMWKENRCFVRV